MYRGVLMLAGFELKSNIGSNKIESHISSLIVLLATTQIRQRQHKQTEQTKSPSTHHHHTHKKTHQIAPPNYHHTDQQIARFMERAKERKKERAEEIGEVPKAYKL